MKNLIFTCIFCIICTSISLLAQEPIDVIKFDRRGKIVKLFFAQGDRALHLKDMVKIAEDNEKALEEMKKGRNKYNLGVATSWAALGLIVWELADGNYCIGDNCQTSTVGSVAVPAVVAGLLISSRKFIKSGTKHLQNGTYIYNEGLKSTETGMNRNKFRPQLGFADSGLGLKLSF